jgi:hypothetical protein
MAITESATAEAVSEKVLQAANENLEHLLANNKVQKLCKSTIILLLEFILAVVSLLFAINAELGGIYLSTLNISFAGTVWAFLLGLYLLRSMFSKQEYISYAFIEVTFAKSNKFPLVEAFYGLYLCKNYTCANSWAFPLACIIWTVYFALVGILCLLIISTSATIIAASLQLAMQLFRASCEVTEFLVRTNLDKTKLLPTQASAQLVSHGAEGHGDGN